MQRCEQGEVVGNELQHMTEQVKSIIQTMNATQVIFSGFIICLAVSFCFSLLVQCRVVS
jgi:hypothetical protein